MKDVPLTNSYTGYSSLNKLLAWRGRLEPLGKK